MRWLLDSTGVWTVVLFLAGVGVSFLPWLRLTIDGVPSTITGLDVWQGGVAVALFGILGLVEVIKIPLGAAPRRWPLFPIAAGVGVAVVAGLYMTQFVFAKLPLIEIAEDAPVSKAFYEASIARNRSDLSVGAPMTMALGLTLVVLGIVEWWGRKPTQ